MHRAAAPFSSSTARTTSYGLGIALRLPVLLDYVGGYAAACGYVDAFGPGPFADEPGVG